jgi:hypothetical protein
MLREKTRERLREKVKKISKEVMLTSSVGLWEGPLGVECFYTVPLALHQDLRPK